MKIKFNQETFLGLLCGFTFAAAAWGYDAVVLAKAHAAMPWLKFIVGLIPSLILGGFAGWMTMRINNLFVRMIFWVAVAVIFSYLTSYVPFTATPYFMKIIDPVMGGRIMIDQVQAITARRFVTMVMIIIFLFIAGLIFENVCDSIRNSRGVAGMVFSAIFLLAFFGGAGYTADSNFNADLRTPIIALDDKLEYVATVDPTTLTEFEQRALRRFTKLDVDFSGKRRLLITTFDQYFTQAEVLVNFEGKLATCNVINGHASTCTMVE